MHVTSEYYRRSGVGRIDFALQAQASESGACARPGESRHSAMPLRPSSETLRRLARLHQRQAYRHHFL